MIRKLSVRIFLASIALLFSVAISSAQQGRSPASRGHIMIPKSSVAQPGDAGVNARTHLRLFVPPDGMNFGPAPRPNELEPFPGAFFETPASLGCIYHLVHHEVPGCNPDVTTENPNIGKGAGAIALIEGFDDPTAAADLAVFTTQFGLPPADLTVTYLTGTEPGLDPTGGFHIETALDLQWAHAMAPQAKLFLIEAPNNSLVNLFEAAQLGASLVAAAGGGEVSMSFGTGEFGPSLRNSSVSETVFDPIFVLPGVVFFASSGDSPGTEYPSVSPNVVSAGGTSISRSPNTGDFILENTWQDAGGGSSLLEPRPAFQDGVRFIVGDTRGTPDLSFDANPATGVWVYDSNPVLGTGWFVVGGTSVSSPSLAGIVNAASSFSNSSQAENAVLYNHIFGGAFNDIVYGTCGEHAIFASRGYDACTGIGTPNTLRNK
jgi:subtilase family serine protease